MSISNRRHNNRRKGSALLAVLWLSAALSAIGDERSVVEVLGTIVSAHVAESMNQLNSLTDCTADQLEARVGQCVDGWYDRLSTDLIYKEQNNAN